MGSALDAPDRLVQMLTLRPTICHPLPLSAAREVLDAAARKVFLQYISQSRNQRNRLDAAKELKKLVFFSNIVVAPLVEDLKARLSPAGQLLLPFPFSRLFLEEWRVQGG